MYEEIDSCYAKTMLLKILRRVEAGERFTITNRGKPVADLVPSRADSKLRIEGVIASILKSKKLVVSTEKLVELKELDRK